jgi:condensin complex subunit 3
MLNTLVVPAVRSQEAPIRERGLLCLGLCCVLGKKLAEENMELFLHCFAKGHPALQTIALQIIADVLITHPSLLAAPPAEVDATAATEQSSENALKKHVLRSFSKSLKSGDPTVQSTGATALSKAFLSRLITDTDLLKQLVIAYFDPDTKDNAQLRQSLSYFLPVYCHSRAENAARMTSITTSIIAKLATLREELLDEAEADSAADAEGGMVKLNVVGTMIVDWTDPRRIVGFAEAAGTAQAADGAGEVHFLLAEEILDRLVTSSPGKEERKVLFSMLNKLHMPAGGCSGDKLKEVLELLQEALDTHVATEATLVKQLQKMFDTLLKQMNEVATAERGGGGAEETIVETTELGTEAEIGDTTAAPIAEATEIAQEEDDEDDDVTQIQRTIRDTTIGAPDAEGTRVQLGGDSEMLSDDDELSFA